MSAPPAAKQAASGSEQPKGLPVDKFLSTLDWAADTHPPSSEGAEPGITPTCIACRKPATSSSEDVAGSTDHLEGFVIFRVASDHRLVFSPIQSSEKATWRFHGVLSVFDAKLRLAIRSSDQGGPRCLTVDIHKILFPPELKALSSLFRLELSLPFVTVVFEVDRRKAPEGGFGAGGSATSEIRLTAMRDAITELLDGPSGSDQAVANVSGENAAGDSVSLFDKQLEEKGHEMNWAETDMQEMFSRFESQCTKLTMPLAFPYRQPESAFEGMSVDQSKHILFVNAFVLQEVARAAGVRQLEACVEMATEARDYGEDKMLSKEEIESRRGRVEIRQPS